MASKSPDVRPPAVHDDLPAFHEETPDERVSLQKFYTEDNAETVTRKSVEVFMTSYYMHRKEPAGERCVSGLQVATSSGAHKPVRVMYREPTPKSWKETWWPAQQMYARAHYTDSFTKYDKKMIFQMNLANAMVLRLKGNPKASPTEKLIAVVGAAANISIASAWRWWGELKVYGAWSNDTYGAHETVSWLLYDRKYADEAREWVRSNTQAARGGTHLQKKAKAAASTDDEPIPQGGVNVERFMNYLNDELIPKILREAGEAYFERTETRRRSNPYRVSKSTALEYLRDKLGFRVIGMGKAVYLDGHDAKENKIVREAYCRTMQDDIWPHMKI